MNILFASKPFLAPRVEKNRRLFVIDGHPIRYHSFDLRFYYPGVNCLGENFTLDQCGDMLWKLSLILPSGESQVFNGKVAMLSVRKSGRDVYFLETINE